MREDYDSGELLLYYLERGDTCAMSMTCCLGEKQSEIRAIGEVPGVILMIPVQKMSEWIGKYKSWMAFVFESYNNRFNELLNAIDTIAFMDMNDRLLNYFLEKSKIEKSKIVLKTHQDIAKELNTSRVVVSKLAKNQRIIIHCQTGVRAVIGYSLFERLGFTDITVYEGGINEWKNLGNKLVSEEWCHFNYNSYVINI